MLLEEQTKQIKDLESMIEQQKEQIIDLSQTVVAENELQMLKQEN